jgi:hypothetical protein
MTTASQRILNFEIQKIFFRKKNKVIGYPMAKVESTGRPSGKVKRFDEILMRKDFYIFFCLFV